jgi:hypothetical protein
MHVNTTDPLYSYDKVSCESLYDWLFEGRRSKDLLLTASVLYCKSR